MNSWPRKLEKPHIRFNKGIRKWSIAFYTDRDRRLLGRLCAVTLKEAMQLAKGLTDALPRRSDSYQ